MSRAPTPEGPKGARNGHLNHRHVVPGPDVYWGRTGSRRYPRGPNGHWALPNRAKTLGPEESSVLRNRLVAELADFGSVDDAAIWAQRSLSEKNKLTDEDARSVEAAFQAKLTNLAARTHEASVKRATSGVDGGPDLAKQPTRQLAGRRSATRGTKQIDKSLLALPEPRRVRDREHIRHVATQACLVCGRKPCDAHHLRFTQSRALGRKVSDEFTIPLCRGHHREVHRCGNEAAWWGKLGIDPTITARALWLESHPLPFGNDEDRERVPDSRAARTLAHRRNRKSNQSSSKRSRNYETKPFSGVATR
jgi:hypothetical protein